MAKTTDPLAAPAPTPLRDAVAELRNIYNHQSGGQPYSNGRLLGLKDTLLALIEVVESIAHTVEPAPDAQP